MAAMLAHRLKNLLLPPSSLKPDPEVTRHPRWVSDHISGSRPLLTLPPRRPTLFGSPFLLPPPTQATQLQLVLSPYHLHFWGLTWPHMTWVYLMTLQLAPPPGPLSKLQAHVLTIWVTPPQKGPRQNSCYFTQAATPSLAVQTKIWAPRALITPTPAAD